MSNSIAPNTSIAAMPAIENIERQVFGWSFTFNGQRCYFEAKPPVLYTNKLYPLKHGDGLRWRVKGRWLSCRQIATELRK